MKRNLNSFASQYKPEASTEIENNLILKWYPQRICARIKNVSSILELGLGHGYSAKIFSSVCDNHVILEGSDIIIDRFKENTPNFNGKIIKTLFEEFVPSREFDVIVMGFVLEHVDDPDLILGHYRRFLGPGGKLYVTVPNAKSLNRRTGFELGLIQDIYSLNENDYALGHQRQYCRATLNKCVTQAGYRVTHEEGLYLKPLPLGFLKKLDNYELNLQAMLRVGVDFPDLCVGLLMELEAN